VSDGFLRATPGEISLPQWPMAVSSARAAGHRWGRRRDPSPGLAGARRRRHDRHLWDDRRGRTSPASCSSCPATIPRSLHARW